MICSNCHYPGHKKETCRKPGGGAQEPGAYGDRPRAPYPRRGESPARRDDGARNVAFPAIFQNDLEQAHAHALSALIGVVTWIIDLGASRHITPDRSNLTSITPLATPVEIVFANGAPGTATEEGTATFTTQDGATITLTNVLLVPEVYACSLISIGQGVDRGMKFTFAPADESRPVATVEISKGGRLITEVPKFGSIYPLWATRKPAPCLTESDACPALTDGSPDSSPTPERAATAAIAGDPVLWHRRYGHVGYERLAQIVDEALVDGLPVTQAQFRNQVGKGKSVEGICDPCMASKLTRPPFHTSHSSVSAPLELVHMT